MATREQLRRNMTATKWIVKYIYRTAKYAGEPVSILEVNNDVNDILNGKEVTRENLGNLPFFGDVVSRLFRRYRTRRLLFKPVLRRSKPLYCHGWIAYP